jgi:hypothetical protein
MPSEIDDIKIVSKFSYSSDEEAILGILKDVFELNAFFLYLLSLSEIADIMKTSMYDEEEEIGNWLKMNYGNELKTGELIKFTYKYKNERDGVDFVYRPYNNEYFSQELVATFDYYFVLKR